MLTYQNVEQKNETLTNNRTPKVLILNWHKQHPMNLKPKTSPTQT